MRVWSSTATFFAAFGAISFCNHFNAYAGAADASLDCVAKTKSGRFRLKGIIPRDSDGFKLMLSNGSGKRRIWRSYKDLSLFTSVRDHVLVFRTRESGGLEFIAWPKTMRVKMRGHDEKATFRARISFERFDRSDLGMQARFSCRYLYEL